MDWFRISFLNANPEKFQFLVAGSNKASHKLHAPQGIKNYLSVDETRLLANAFIDTQFNYAPLVWVFAGKTLINKIYLSFLIL